MHDEDPGRRLWNLPMKSRMASPSIPELLPVPTHRIAEISGNLIINDTSRDGTPAASWHRLPAGPSGCRLRRWRKLEAADEPFDVRRHCAGPRRAATGATTVAPRSPRSTVQYSKTSGLPSSLLLRPGNDRPRPISSGTVPRAESPAPTNPCLRRCSSASRLYCCDRRGFAGLLDMHHQRVALFVSQRQVIALYGLQTPLSRVQQTNAKQRLLVQQSGFLFGRICRLSRQPCRQGRGRRRSV